MLKSKQQQKNNEVIAMLFLLLLMHPITCDWNNLNLSGTESVLLVLPS